MGILLGKLISEFIHYYNILFKCRQEFGKVLMLEIY